MPSKTNLPFCESKKPAISLNVVVFPQPLGPNSDTSSPSSTSKFKSFKQEIYASANNYLNSIARPYEVYIPGALALALFLGLQILNWPLRFLLSIISSLVLRILTTLGMVKKNMVKVDKEELLG